MSQVPTRPEPTNAQLEDRILAGFEELRTLIARLSLTGGSPVATGPVPNLTDAPGTVAYNAPPRPDPNIPQTSTDAWWKAQPPEVQALRYVETGDGTGRLLAALDLVRRGFVIDPPIVVNGRHPASVMSERFALGRPWTMPLGSPQVRMGFDGPVWNGQKYNPHSPPPGALITWLDFAIPYYEADRAAGIIWNLPPEKA